MGRREPRWGLRPLQADQRKHHLRQSRPWAFAPLTPATLAAKRSAEKNSSSCFPPVNRYLWLYANVTRKFDGSAIKTSSIMWELRDAAFAFDRRRRQLSRARGIRMSTLRVMRTAAGRPCTRNEAVHISPTVAAMLEPVRTHAPDPSSLEPHYCRAICQEIGERLWFYLGRDPSPVPMRLRRLVTRFAELDGVAPSIIPDRTRF